MKIGIIGPADRAVAWEKHIRSHRIISEVTITAKLSEVGNVDACLLLDNQETDQSDLLLEAVKKGYHSFSIAPLLTKTSKVEKIYHAAEESNVLLQFSHWPTLAPASKWMAKQISRPSFMQISREISHADYLESSHSFDYYWIDELAFCMRWINSAVHHIDLKTVDLSQNTIFAMHMLLRFDSGATANIFINAASAQSNHHRVAANNHYLLDCDVLNQTVRKGEANESGDLYFSKQSFDASKAAELAALEFIKSIQLNRQTIYNGYHLLELAKTIDTVKKRLARV